MTAIPRHDSRSNNDRVELSIPALPELLSLPRLVAAAVAARCGFDVEEVEDVRLAIEELCLAAFDGRGAGRLHVGIDLGADTLAVDCTFEPDGTGAGETPRRGSVASELTEQLLEALADEHGTETSGGVTRAWFRKARGATSVG
jgi:hypothetical protein